MTTINIPPQFQAFLDTLNANSDQISARHSQSVRGQNESATTPPQNSSSPLPIPKGIQDFLAQLKEEKIQRAREFARMIATEATLKTESTNLDNSTALTSNNPPVVSSPEVVTQPVTLSTYETLNNQNNLSNLQDSSESNQLEHNQDNYSNYQILTSNSFTQTANSQNSPFNAQDWLTEANLEDTANYLQECPDLEVFAQLLAAIPGEVIERANLLLPDQIQLKVIGWLNILDTQKNSSTSFDSHSSISSISNQQTEDNINNLVSQQLNNYLATKTLSEVVPNIQQAELLSTANLEKPTINVETINNNKSNLDLNKTNKIPYYLVETDSDLETALNPWLDTPVLAIDLETTGLDPHLHKIRLIQIAVPQQPVVIIDVDKIKNLAPLQLLLNNQGVKIGHNLKFDIKFLTQAGLTVNPPLFDTQIASQLLSAGIKGEHSLKQVCKSYLDLELDKQQQKSDWSQELTPSQLEYAAHDAAILLPLRDILKAKLIESNLTQVAKIEFDCILAVAAMELAGMLLDAAQWQQLAQEMEANAIYCAQELTKLLSCGLPATANLFTDKPPEIDINSPPQLLKALQTMGIPVNSTAKKEIAPLASQYPVIQALIEYRHWNKAKTSFGKTLPNHIHSKTGRIHPQYWQIGAVSGRFSCSNPNLQQIPRQKEVRQCFIASPGNSLVIADYSQIELRIAAEISRDTTMIQAYQQGQDLHKLTASLVLGKPLELVTSEDRQLAKAINFGLIYGISAKGLQEYAFSNYGVNMNIKQAAQFRDKFFSGYSGLAHWQKQQACLLYQKGVRETRTLANRRRLWDDKPRLTEMLNTPVQGTSADITKLALANLRTVLVDTGAKIIGVVHDEIILESPESNTSQVAQTLVQLMQNAGAQFLQQVPVVVEAKIAKNWGDK